MCERGVGWRTGLFWGLSDQTRILVCRQTVPRPVFGIGAWCETGPRVFLVGLDGAPWKENGFPVSSPSPVVPVSDLSVPHPCPHDPSTLPPTDGGETRN